MGQAFDLSRDVRNGPICSSLLRCTVRRAPSNQAFRVLRMDDRGGQDQQTAFQGNGCDFLKTYEAVWLGPSVADYQFSASIDPGQVKHAT